MLKARITIDGREHHIPSVHEAEVIMTTITEQVRAGGGFVEVLRTPERALSVLVTPGLNVSIELRMVEDDPAASDADEPPPVQTWMDAFDSW